MTQNPSNFIWIDLEMTGLNVDTDLIIEIATVITDNELNILATGPVLAINQPDSAIMAMDKWNQKHHSKSKLIERIKESTINAREAERQTIEFVQQWVKINKSPMCGNSVCQDRRFLHNYMPDLEQYFHYRNLDVSSLKILASHWKPEIVKGFHKKSAHKALDDVIESIEELKYYRKYLIKP